MTGRFEHVIAAVEAREKHKGQVDGTDLWAIGDALIRDCGAPNHQSTRAGPRNLVQNCAGKLVQLGYKEYKATYLLQLRQIAHTFPRNQRHPELPFHTHAEAKNPDFLDWMIEEHGLNISKRDCRRMRTRWHQVERQRREEMRREAQAEERRARTPAERSRARNRADELSGPPTPSRHMVGRPSRPALNRMRDMGECIEIDGDIKDAKKKLRKSLTSLHRMTDIHEAYADAYLEDCEAIVELATQILNFLRQRRFSVIEGGRNA